MINFVNGRYLIENALNDAGLKAELKSTKISGMWIGMVNGKKFLIYLTSIDDQFVTMNLYGQRGEEEEMIVSGISDIIGIKPFCRYRRIDNSQATAIYSWKLYEVDKEFSLLERQERDGPIYWLEKLDEGFMRNQMFLYPKSRQFPVDEVCEQIVRELEKRNWRVPGIDVEFYSYGGINNYRMVNSIRGVIGGNNFKLRFCRGQGSLPGGFNDIAAVTELFIPEKQLDIFEDESGPRLYLYVGGDWKWDREWFLTGSKVHSKLQNKPRMYLVYKGSWKRPHEPGYNYTYPKQRSPWLVADNDLGREYDPGKGDPEFFSTDDVLSEFAAWLKKIVLSHIKSQPIVRAGQKALAESCE